MMEVGSFTSEPQYQRPDQIQSDIDYIKAQEPMILGQAQPTTPVVPVPVPVSSVSPSFGYDPLFAQRLFKKMGSEYITCNRLDGFGNAIPLGSFCYAIAFIVYGFYRCRVYRINDSFLWAIILIFGGIGQVTAGFLEFCKGRTFPTALYLTTGFYCLSHYAYYTIPTWFQINQNQSMLYNFTENSVCAFYVGWVFIMFAIVVVSIKTNLLYILQCITGWLFFFLRAIGEGCGSLGTKRNAAGILQSISGFLSLIICFSQILNNETLYRNAIPTFPTGPYNDIDIMTPLPPGVAPQNVPIS